MGSRDGAQEGLVIEIRDAANILRFESQWRDLARRSSPHTMAQTFEWALTAVEFDLAEKRRCFLVIVHEGERWSAVMGLTLHRDFHRSLRPFSAGSHEEYSGPLLEAGRERVLADKILALATSIPADRLMLYNLTAGHATDLAADALPLPQSVQALQAYVSRHARYANWARPRKSFQAATVGICAVTFAGCKRPTLRRRCSAGGADRLATPARAWISRWRRSDAGSSKPRKPPIGLVTIG